MPPKRKSKNRQSRKATGTAPEQLRPVQHTPEQRMHPVLPETRPLLVSEFILEPSNVHDHIYPRPTPFFVLSVKAKLPHDWIESSRMAFLDNLDIVLRHKHSVRHGGGRRKYSWRISTIDSKSVLDLEIWPLLDGKIPSDALAVTTDMIHKALEFTAKSIPPFPTLPDYSDMEALLARFRSHGVCHMFHPLDRCETKVVAEVLEAMALSVFWPPHKSATYWLTEYHKAGRKFQSGQLAKLPEGVSRISGNAFQFYLEGWKHIFDWAETNNVPKDRLSVLDRSLKKMQQNRTSVFVRYMKEFFGATVLEEDIKISGIALLLSIPGLTYQQMDHYDAHVMGVYSTLLSIGRTTKTTIFRQRNNFLDLYEPRAPSVGERHGIVRQTGHGLPLKEADVIYATKNYSPLKDRDPDKWSPTLFIPGSEVGFLGLAQHAGAGNDCYSPSIPDCSCYPGLTPKPSYIQTSLNAQMHGVLFCGCQLCSPPARLPQNFDPTTCDYKAFDQIYADPDNNITSEGQIRSSAAVAFLDGYSHSRRFVELARNVLYDGVSMINYLDDDEITQQLMWYMRAAQLVDLYDDSCLPIVSDMLENITQMSLTEWAEYNSGIVGDANGLEEGVVEKNEVDTQLMVFLDNEDDEEDRKSFFRIKTSCAQHALEPAATNRFKAQAPAVISTRWCQQRRPELSKLQQVKNSRIDSRLKHQLCLARAGASSDGETTRPSRCLPRIDSKSSPELSKLQQVKNSRIDSRLKHQLCLARAGASSDGDTTRPSRCLPRIDSKSSPELSKLQQVKNSRIDSRLKHQLCLARAGASSDARAGASSDGETTRPSRCLPRIDSKSSPELSKLQQVKNSRIDSRLKHQLCLARAGASSDGEKTRPSRCLPRIDSKSIPELSKLQQVKNSKIDLRHSWLERVRQFCCLNSRVRFFPFFGDVWEGPSSVSQRSLSTPFCLQLVTKTGGRGYVPEEGVALIWRPVASGLTHSNSLCFNKGPDAPALVEAQSRPLHSVADSSRRRKRRLVRHAVQTALRSARVLSEAPNCLPRIDSKSSPELSKLQQVKNSRIDSRLKHQLCLARAGASSDGETTRPSRCLPRIDSKSSPELSKLQQVKNSRIDSRLKHQLCLARAGASSNGETTRPSRCLPRIDSKSSPELSKLQQVKNSRIDSRLKHQLCLARAGASSDGETTRPSRCVPRIDSKSSPELSKHNRNSRIDSRLKHQL
ncbi:hypothetical protein BDR26DRAFT_893112 [Obelidium mucronatum]|nr:hypothetical protein BDR26DRAFT_893112 [Obelidium mucronatum]